MFTVKLFKNSFILKQRVKIKYNFYAVKYLNRIKINDEMNKMIDDIRNHFSSLFNYKLIIIVKRMNIIYFQHFSFCVQRNTFD